MNGRRPARAAGPLPPLEERDAAGVVLKSYTLGLDVLAQAAPAIAAGGSLAFLYDLHGSTRALLNGSGLVHSGTGASIPLQLFTYDAYGELIDPGFGVASLAAALTSLLYSGESTSAATGLQYLRARWYDAASGRFNRLDPFFGDQNSPISFHKYLYTHANPVMGVDPTGFFTQRDGYLAEGAIQDVYSLDHPGDYVRYGQWIRLAI